MRSSYLAVKNEIKNLSEKITGSVFGVPILLNQTTLIFPFLNNDQNYLVIDLNKKDPFIYTISSTSFFSTLESKGFLRVRKNIDRFEILSITLDENDFIVYLKIKSLEFDEEKQIIVELFPIVANLYVVDKNGEILASMFNFENGNKIGDLYTKPQSILINKNDNYLSLENSIRWENSLTNRFDEKYSSFKKYINSKIKLIKRKLSNIEQDKFKAEKDLILSEHADEIFTLGLDLKSHKKEILLGEKIITLDSTKTILENINNFYKKAKKAKETIRRNQENMDSANKELSEFESVAEKIQNCSEKEAENLLSTYGVINKKKEVQKTEFNRPWKINLNGTIIYFGRNASQNDYLSFVMKLDREFTWLHIKDKSGSHLVIANKKPTENELIFASEIALLCSRCSSGEVTYTKKKNVRRGHVLGEAILKNHSTIKLNNIRKETIDVFALAKRVD